MVGCRGGLMDGPGHSAVGRRGFVGLVALLLVVGATLGYAQAPLPGARTATPEAIAAALLDDTQDQKAREALAKEAAPRAAEVVTALVQGLPDRDEAEEYRRIPWIWRVAVAAGRARDEAALQALMDVSLPAPEERLRDWQAVVLGGGVVMGLSQAGVSPRDTMAPWLAKAPTRRARWTRSLDLAERMADDPTIRNGTRYDALRMLAVLPFDRVGAQLERYLSRSVDPELQMGAIGALGDLQDPRAAAAITRHMDEYTERNRGIATTALEKHKAR